MEGETDPPAGPRPGGPRPSGGDRLLEIIAALWRGMRTVNADQREMNERMWLLQCPWEEDFLHWGADGNLHGHLMPPLGRRRHSVTGTGWCPGLARRDIDR